MSQQCTATAKSTGERCQNDAIKGGTVCWQHGGAASQVQQKAQERLDRMADAITADEQQNLDDLQAEYEQAGDIETKLNILAEMRKHWKIVLDRTDNGPTETREVTGEGGGGIIIRTTAEDDGSEE